MVNLRRGADVNKPKPRYEKWSFDCTMVLHFDGKFCESNGPDYIGGEKLVFDYVNANRIKYSDLKVCAGMRMKGVLRFWRLVVGGFNLIKETNDLQEWAKKHMRSREFHVYTARLDPHPQITTDLVELPPQDKSYESSDEGETSEEEENGEEGEHGEEFEQEPQFIIGDDVDDDVHDNAKTGNSAQVKGKEPVDPSYVESDKSESSDNSSEEEGDVVHIDDDDFDETRVSDGDDNKPKHPMFNPRTVFNPIFTLGQCFSSKQEFRKAVQSHAILTKRTLRTIKNDGERVYVHCKAITCKWRMRLHKLHDENCWQLREYHAKHECATVHKVKNMKSTWLSERFIQRFQSDANRSVSGFRTDTVNDVECHVSRQQAYRAKKKALELIQGNPNDQFGKLWSYADELRRTNPGSTIIVGVDDQNRFSNFYVCFEALKRGFLGGCRPIIGVDGCFLKSVHGGILLTAVGIDPNNNLFPIAYAVVSAETTETWEWFLTILKQDLFITNPHDFTFISDKQKGLISACGSVFPGAEHRFCVRHLHNNMKAAGWTGLAFKNMLWAAAQSTTPGEFRVKMRALKDYNQFAWEWFNDKPPNQWSKAFFRSTPKCDMLLNNACESFNSTILEARDKPIITMLEWIRQYLMSRQQKNRDRAMASWKGKICPKISKILETYMQKIHEYIPMKCNNSNYQVSCSDGTQYTVNLARWICSCRSWDLTGIPCKHALCAILSEELNPEDFVDRFYYVETYIKVYEPAIMGISYEQLWGDVMYVPPLPPNFGKKKRGRPKTARKRDVDEPKTGSKKKKTERVRLKRQQITVRCGKCNSIGHNSRSTKCPLAIVEEAVQPVDLQPVEVPSEQAAGGKGHKLRKKLLSSPTPKQKKARGRPKKGSKPLPPQANIIKPPPPVTEHILIPNERQENVVDGDISTFQDYMGLDRPLQEGPTMYEQLLMGQNGACTSQGPQTVLENIHVIPAKKKPKKQKKVKQAHKPTFGLVDEDNDDAMLDAQAELVEKQVAAEVQVLCDQPPPSQASQEPFQFDPLFSQPPPPPVPHGVQIRAPPPFFGGLLTAAWFKNSTVQPETTRQKKLVVENGVKYMDLSTEDDVNKNVGKE